MFLILIIKTNLNTKAKEIENKIPHVTNLVTKSTLDTKVRDIENEIIVITGFVTTTNLNRLTKSSFNARM